MPQEDIHGRSGTRSSRAARLRSSFVVLGLLGSSALSGRAWAQEPRSPAANPAPNDGDIIVTAQKREQRLQDVGQTVAVLSGADLVKEGIRTVAQLAISVPSLTTATTEFGTPVLTLRGVGFYESSIAASPAVTLYTDQVPIAFLVESTGSLFDLERVEVLKGPQGTLFGQNSTGGAINLIAAKPTSTLSAGGNISYSRFNAFDGNLYVSGPLTDNLKARLALQTLQGGAWQRSHSRPEDHLGNRDLDSARLTLDWKPTDRLSAELMLSGWINHSETQQPQYIASVPGIPGVPFRPGPGDPLTDTNNRDADWDPGVDYKHHDRQGLASLHLGYELADRIQLTSITAASGFKYRFRTDEDGTPFQNGANLNLGHTRSFFQELRLNAVRGPLTLTAGLNYSKLHASEVIVQGTSQATYRLALSPLYSEDEITVADAHRVETKAAFANLEVKATDRITLIGGVRYTDDHRKYTYCLNSEPPEVYLGFRDALRGAFGLPPGPQTLPAGYCIPFGPAPTFDIGGPTHRTLKENNVSWRGTVQMKPIDPLLLYVTVARGYKSGTFPFSAAFFNEGLLSVKQEHLTDYEGGFKLSLGRALQFNGAAFYYDYRNKQIKANVLTLLGPLLTLVGVPKSRVIGAEFDTRLRLFDGLTLRASGTVVSTKVLDDFVNVDPFNNTFNFKGQRLPLTPKWSTDADAEYRRPIFRDWSAYVGGHVNYASHSQAQFVDPADPRSASFKLPARALIDARVGFENSKLGIEFWGRNITNEFYWTNVYKGADTENRLVGLPATYGVSLSFKY